VVALAGDGGFGALPLGLRRNRCERNQDGGASIDLSAAAELTLISGEEVSWSWGRDEGAPVGDGSGGAARLTPRDAT